ncbi:MAG: class I SAM-dependent methyltransferase [Spirochaetia bacterium]|nr:class I SAM-dependent methyltransferase [Spirochaetia bacterium]
MSGLLEELAERGVEVPAGVREAFDWDALTGFREFLGRENERGGFFSKADAERIPDRHVYECAVIAYYVSGKVEVSRETRVADVGSGPGLPGFVFACLKSAPHVTLIDSSRRRLSLLEEWMPQEFRDRVEFSYARAEELKGSPHDIVTVRALIPHPFFLELITRIVRLKGWVVRATTGDTAREYPDQEKYLNQLGFVPRETVRLPELDFLGNRSIQYFQKIRTPAPGFPRAWNRIQSDMRQWAE